MILTLHLHLLDFTQTVGFGSGPTRLNLIQNPNKINYFFGLLLAFSIQILVIYDYFYNYSICSQFFFRSKWVDTQYLIKKFSLTTTSTVIIDYYFWPTTLTLFFFEALFCYINFYYYNKSLLYLSIFIWTISVIGSIISLTFINAYIRKNDDLMVLLRARETKIILLEKELESLALKWKLEAMEEQKENFDESTVQKRLDEYKMVKLRVIDEMLETNETTFLAGTLENIDFFYEGTVLEFFSMPTQQNIFNLILYLYYLNFCALDSEALNNFMFTDYSQTILDIIQIIFWDNSIFSAECLDSVQTASNFYSYIILTCL